MNPYRWVAGDHVDELRVAGDLVDDVRVGGEAVDQLLVRGQQTLLGLAHAAALPQRPPWAPRNVWQVLKLPDILGNLNWLNCNIILITINEAYLVALRATVTLTYFPVTGTQ